MSLDRDPCVCVCCRCDRVEELAALVLKAPRPRTLTRALSTRLSDTIDQLWVALSRARLQEVNALRAELRELRGHSSLGSIAKSTTDDLVRLAEATVEDAVQACTMWLGDLLAQQGQGSEGLEPSSEQEAMGVAELLQSDPGGALLCLPHASGAHFWIVRVYTTSCSQDPFLSMHAVHDNRSNIAEICPSPPSRSTSDSTHRLGK